MEHQASPVEDLLRCGKFEIPILLCDNQVLVAVKPCNMPVQADCSGDMDLLTALKGYVGKRYNKPGAVFLGLVHRLDRPVGGVMVFARTSKAASRLSAAFSAHTVQKKYLAVLQGRMAAEADLTHHLLKDEKSGMVRAVSPSAPGAKEARLTTRPIAWSEAAGTTLTEVTLHTGRAHQIRVQHLSIGHPLWGDSRYGGGKPGQQIALWAHQLAFEHPTQKTELRFTCPPPMSGVWQDYEAAILQ